MAYVYTVQVFQQGPKFVVESFRLYEYPPLRRFSLTLIRRTKDEKGLDFFKGLLL